MTKVLCVYLCLIYLLNQGNCEKQFLNYGNDEYAHIKLNTPIHFYSNVFDHINVRIIWIISFFFIKLQMKFSLFH